MNGGGGGGGRATRCRVTIIIFIQEVLKFTIQIKNQKSESAIVCADFADSCKKSVIHNLIKICKKKSGIIQNV